MVDPRVNETLQTGAVENRTYRRSESVHLFFEFTIVFHICLIFPSLLPSCVSRGCIHSTQSGILVP